MKGLQGLLAVSCVVLLAASARAQTTSAPATYPTKCGELYTLARQYAAKGAAGADDSKALAAYVAQKYATDSAAGAVDWSQWWGLIAELGAYYPQATKDAMCGDLQQQLSSTTEALGKLSGSMAFKVSRSLWYLGRAQASFKLVVDWVNASEQYKSTTPDYLSLICFVLSQAGESGKNARQKVAAFVKTKYLGDAASAKLITIPWWQTIVGSLAKDVDADTAALWVKQLRAAYAPTNDEAIKLGNANLRALVGMLTALGDKQATEMLSAGVGDTATLGSMKFGELLWSLSSLKGDTSQAASDSRDRLFAQLATKYLVDTKTASTQPTSPLRDTMGAIAKDLTAAQKAAWIPKLRAGFLGDPQDLTTVSEEVFLNMLRILATLGDNTYPDLAASLVTGTTNWQSWGPDSALRLALEMHSGKSQTCKTARQKVIDLIQTKYLPDAKARGSNYWTQAVMYLVRDMTPDNRTQWVAKIRGAFVGDLQTITGQGAAELEKWIGLLAQLGDDQAYRLVMDVINGGAAWQSWQPKDIKWLAQNLKLDSSDDNKKARKTLGDLIQSKFLADAKAAQSFDVKDWPVLVKFISTQDESTLTALAGKLTDAFAGSAEVLAALPMGDFQSLMNAVGYLDGKKATVLLAGYLASPNIKAGASVADATGLVAKAVGKDKAGILKLLEDMDKDWQTQNSQKPFGWHDCELIASAWQSVDNSTKAQAWAQLALQAAVGSPEARAAADTKTVFTISALLEKVGLTGKDKAYATIASTIVDLAKAGKLDDHVWFYSASPARTLGNIDMPVMSKDNGSAYVYFTTDANMNVTGQVSDSASVTERYAYDAYGAVTFLTVGWAANGSPSHKEVLYCGYRYDPESGLYLARNRYYHPRLGRWITRDPAGYVDGASSYEYCLSSPVGFADWEGAQTAMGRGPMLTGGNGQYAYRGTVYDGKRPRIGLIVVDEKRAVSGGTGQQNLSRNWDALAMLAELIGGYIPEEAQLHVPFEVPSPKVHLGPLWGQVFAGASLDVGACCADNGIADTINRCDCKTEALQVTLTGEAGVRIGIGGEIGAGLDPKMPPLQDPKGGKGHGKRARQWRREMREVTANNKEAYSTLNLLKQSGSGTTVGTRTDNKISKCESGGKFKVVLTGTAVIQVGYGHQWSGTLGKWEPPGELELKLSDTESKSVLGWKVAAEAFVEGKAQVTYGFIFE